MAKTTKTNAVRLLEQHGVAYELVDYAVDENDLGATHIASTAGLPVEQVFKTLVLRGDKSGLFVCVIPGASEIDLKKAARLSGNKKCDLIAVKEMLGLTGYIRGGCSPVGMKKSLPTYLDASCQQFGRITVSAGQRGLLVWIAPADLVAVTNATICELT